MKKVRAEVLFFGDINVDVMLLLPRPLAAGHDNLASALRLNLGGVAANTAAALAQWGIPTRLMGCVGRDSFGDFVLKRLSSLGVDASCVSRTNSLTGIFAISAEPGGRRTLLGGRGANSDSPGRSPIVRALSGVRAVHLEGYTLLSPSTGALTIELARRARRCGMYVSFDAGLAPCREARKEILQMAPNLNALFLGEEEAEALTRRTGRRALRAIERLGVAECVVKLGNRGCKILQSGKWRTLRPFAVAAVDSTGAGDAFAAAYIFARLQEFPMAEAATLANAAGAGAATVLGAADSFPGRKKILALLERDARSSPASRRVLDRIRAVKHSFNSHGG